MNKITGENTAPKPAQAYETSDKTCEFGFIAKIVAMIKIKIIHILPTQISSLWLFSLFTMYL